MRWAILPALCGQVAAACPVGADLASGIVVTEPEGYTNVYRAETPRTVTQSIDFGDGEVARNVLALGVYVQRLAVEVDGVLDVTSVVLTDYGNQNKGLTPPVPGLEQVLRTTVTTIDEVYKETQTQVWGELGEMTIGGCSYAMIPGQVTYENDQDSIAETISYLPDLGIGLLTSFAFVGEEVERYSFTDIAVAE